MPTVQQSLYLQQIKTYRKYRQKRCCQLILLLFDEKIYVSFCITFCLDNHRHILVYLPIIFSPVFSLRYKP